MSEADRYNAVTYLLDRNVVSKASRGEPGEKRPRVA